MLPAATAVQADLVVTLFEAPDGSTSIEISGSGQTTDSGSNVFSAGMTPQFLGLDDSTDYFGTAGTLMGTVGGMAAPFVPGLRLLDGASADTVQFTLGAVYSQGDAYSFSGVGNFPTLDFSEFLADVTATSLAGDAQDFANFSVVVVPEPAATPAALAVMLALLLIRRRRQVPRPPLAGCPATPAHLHRRARCAENRHPCETLFALRRTVRGERLALPGLRR